MAAVIATLKGRIASLKVPKRVHVVDELPRNAMGKLRKTYCASALRRSGDKASGQRGFDCRKNLHGAAQQISN